MTSFTRAQWGARPARPGPGRLDPRQVVGLAFHWPGMASPIRGVEAVARALRGWQAFHMDGRGWSDIAYQVAIDQDGNRYDLRGLDTQSGANGNTDVNERYGAVLLVIAPGEKPTEAMIRTARQVVADHRARFPRSERLVGHQQIRPDGTSCPGPAVMAAIRGHVFEPRDVRRRPRRLVIRQANLYREERQKVLERGLDALVAGRPHLVGTNESANHLDELQAVADDAGYRLVVHDRSRRARAQNTVLLRDDVELLGSFVRTMCPAVGDSPERTALVVKYRYAGRRRAHIQTHANSHVQDGGEPHRLPRVQKGYVPHMRALRALVDELEADDHAVTLAGDLNWAWARKVAWVFAPKRVLRRAGLRAQWGHKTAPVWRRRRIDYIAYDPDELTILGQRLVAHDTTDPARHPWPEVTFEVKETR